MSRASAIGGIQRRARIVPTEHAEQAALMRWVTLATPRIPQLAQLFAIPNAGKRSERGGAWMKAEGLRAGVPDLLLAEGRELAGGDWINGLFIEMKRRGFTASDVKPEQRDWHERLTKAGYMVKVCGGFEDARDTICTYLGVRP